MDSEQHLAPVTELMDFLKIPKAIFAGYDWGGRGANVAAALWPERCSALVSVDSYLIQDLSKAGTRSIQRLRQILVFLPNPSSFFAYQLCQLFEYIGIKLTLLNYGLN